jgi:hypothetical protein
MKLRQRYALLTVDTEALPKRAAGDHVNRLVWGRHDKGTAGIREVCSIGDDFKVKHIFFVDLCGAYSYLDEMRGVVGWLVSQVQDVQLHVHPEVLPEVFWTSNGLSSRPALMDEYAEVARSEFIIGHFGRQLSEVTGKNVLAFRAGSFRWNASTIRALKNLGIPLSFNNSMRALRGGQSVFSEPTNYPYAWSNGVIEIPVTEKMIPPQPGRKELWASLTYPESPYFRFGEDRPSLLSKLLGRTPGFLVFLLHSWSFLYWDENGHATYRDDQRLEGYRKLLARLTKDYDVITTKDFLDLHARGKIKTSHTVNVEQAELRG